MWLQDGNAFRTRDPGNDIPKLPPFVYTITRTMMGTWLEKQQERFEFPYKIYGATDFPARVAHNYKHTTGNLGVMLTGLKGTGKTVEAELMCNVLGLPVILVNENFDGITQFLNRIPEDIVIFIDEYEKIFERSNALLSLMDGALRTQHRRVFLLTTNDMYVSPAIMNRPSRVFYMKKFGNLDEAMITEIVHDMLADTASRMEAIRFLATLQIITIDIVKAVCAEMLRFSEMPNAFKDLLNVEQTFTPRKTVHHIVGGREILLGTDCVVEPRDPFNPGYIEDEFGEENLNIADGPESRYVDYGRIKAMNKTEGLITTEQGVFRISEHHTHASLRNYLTVVA